MQAVDVFSLPASRALDALVAEKVMGQRVKHDKYPIGWKPGTGLKEPSVFREDYFLLDESGNIQTAYGPLAHGIVRITVPHYSTSIAAAWKVVEQFEHGRFAPNQVAAYVELHCSDGLEAERYWCEFKSPSLAAVSATADTAPLAICWAALKAVGC